MTEIRAKVVEFDLVKHPNADLLSIATIRETGWSCVVKTSDFEGITKAIYFPLDSLLKTTRPEFAFLDKTGSGKPARVKTIRLRQVISQGLLLPAPENAQVGDDLTEFYEVERYEPEVHVNLAGGMVRSPANFVKYTSIENYKNYPRVLQECEPVLVTEKLHGSSYRAGYIFNDKFDENNKILEYYVGSHNVAKDPDDANLFSKMARDLNLKEKLKPIAERYNTQQQFIIFGELMGSGVQHLTYDCARNEQKLRLFDVLIDHKYQPWETVQEIAAEIGIETVPVLYRGPYSKEKVMELRDGPTTLGGKHIREGVVVKAEPERFEHMGRVILKFISDDYLLNQGKKGSTDGH